MCTLIRSLLGWLCLGILFAIILWVATHYMFRTVQTTSMQPAVQRGSLVVVRRNQQPKPGDVASYEDHQLHKTITHRLVWSNDSQYVFKGDANKATDSPVDKEHVLGTVVGNLPKLGLVINFVRTLPGLIVCIYLPALLIVLYETRHLIRQLVMNT